MADYRIVGGWKTPVFFVLAVLIVCAVSYMAGRVKGRRIGYGGGYSDGYEAGWSAPHPADTEWLEVIKYVDRPVPVSSIPAGVELLPVGTLAQMQARIDSLLAVQPDTAFVEIPVPIEARYYAGEEYEAQVSGWHPSLDWIRIRQQTGIVTPATPQPPKRGIHVSFGATAGYGIMWTPDGVRAGPGATAGLTLSF